MSLFCRLWRWRRRFRLRRGFIGLVVVQVALSVVLLSAAGLFVGHLSNLRNVNLGFQRDSLLLVTLNPQGSGYDRSQLTAVYRELLEELRPSGPPEDLRARVP